jgi:hypothetical protein
MKDAKEERLAWDIAVITLGRRNTVGNTDIQRLGISIALAGGP